MGLFTSRKASSSPLPMSGHIDLPSSRSVALFIRSRINGRRKHHAQSASSHAADRVASSETISPYPLNYPSFDCGNDKPAHSTYSGANQQNLVQQDSYRDSRRSSADASTTTLAHRLNELATANADGLLSDDDYRVLRQDLFKAFASASSPPKETPVVRSIEPGALGLSSVSQSDCLSRSPAGAPSVQTHTTRASSVSNLFRRVWQRTSPGFVNEDELDLTSIVSSSPQVIFPRSTASISRHLARQASSSSIKTSHSQQISSDLRSLSSRTSMKSMRTTSETGAKSRASTRSLRGAEPPPSSFRGKRLASLFSSVEGADDRLRSADDIREEIRATEVERQSVLATFSSLAQRQYSGTSSAEAQAAWTTISGGLPAHSELYSDHKRSSIAERPLAIDLIFNEMSTKGGVYVVYCSRRASVHKQTSGGNASQVHYAPSGPDARLQTDGIDERRAEVAMRYQQRLDYLRARLKGAEIHERLLRK